MAPVIFRPDIGDAFPLLIPSGQDVVPAVADDPCDCCDPGVVCGECDGEVLPDTVLLNVRGMANGHPFLGCQECDELNGSYLLPPASNTGCGWEQFVPISLCPNPFGQAYNLMRLGVGINESIIVFQMTLYFSGTPSSFFYGSIPRAGGTCLEDLAAASIHMGGPSPGDACTHAGADWDLTL